MQPKLIKFPKQLEDAIQAQAELIAKVTGERPNFSAMVRLLVRVGLEHELQHRDALREKS